MASTSAAYSTVTNNLQVQAKLGLKIFGDVYFGPEAKFTWQKVFPFQVNFSPTSIATTAPVSPQEHVATTRVGGHLSAVSLGPVLFSTAALLTTVSLYRPFRRGDHPERPCARKAERQCLSSDIDIRNCSRA
jgi:hypothetical protein